MLYGFHKKIENSCQPLEFFYGEISYLSTEEGKDEKVKYLFDRWYSM